MGKYTIFGPEVDKAIEQQLKSIVDKLTKDLPEIELILLVGGFGRGEGSVKKDNEIIRPIKDFDFDLIFHKKIPYQRVRKCGDYLRKELSPVGPSSDPYPYRAFTVDLNATTIDRMNLLPDITVYEAKVASQVLYGKDLRHKIRIVKEDVPFRSGARILFQKGISLIGQLSTSYLDKSEIPGDKKEMFIYECTKVFVEIGTALSILRNIYEPSYYERMLAIEKDYGDLFPELYENIPDLDKKITRFTRFKLAPDFSIIEDPISLWFDARNCLLDVIEYYMSNYLGVKESNWLKFCSEVRKGLQREHHRPLIQHNIKRRFWLSMENRTLAVANYLFQFYDNLCYIKNIEGCENYTISLKSPDWFCSPYIKFFYATLPLLYSLHEDGSFDQEQLIMARNALGLKRNSSSYFKDNLWEDTRQIYLKSLSLLPCMF